MFKLILRKKFQNFVFEDGSRANLENNDQKSKCLQFLEKAVIENQMGSKMLKIQLELIQFSEHISKNFLNSLTFMFVVVNIKEMLISNATIPSI